MNDEPDKDAIINAFLQGRNEQSAITIAIGFFGILSLLMNIECFSFGWFVLLIAFWSLFLVGLWSFTNHLMFIFAVEALLREKESKMCYKIYLKRIGLQDGHLIYSGRVHIVIKTMVID